MSTVAGWDIGGAHVKLALVESGAVKETTQHPCPLWQGVEELRRALADARSRVSDTATHAVTLTGELVDLFPDRATGVHEILEVVRRELSADTRVYAGPAGLLSLDSASERPLDVASANWHASAQLLALRGARGVLVDIGSTTTDIVPVSNGGVGHHHVGDHQRLISGELVYTGVVRTPVLGLTHHLKVRGIRVPLMAEMFATTADVYRLNGELPDDADPWPTADGGPRDEEGSARRLLRMVGLDLDIAHGIALARELAEQLRDVQLRLLVQAFRQVASGLPGAVIAAGSGRFLVRAMAQELERECVSYEQACGIDTGEAPELANFAPALAVALLLEAGHG